MKIGGYMPMTLSDYPGHVASVIFTQGCNFRCPFCHNSGLIPMHPEIAEFIPQSHVFQQLEKRKNFLQGVVISGGEPTLQSDLPDFIRRIRHYGLKIKLDTNGSRPEMLEALFEDNLIDYVAMDVKAPYGLYSVLAGVHVSERGICESIKLISGSGVDHIFRTTLVPELLTLEDLCDLRKMLPVGSFHIEQELQREHTLDPMLRQGAYSEHLEDTLPFVNVGAEKTLSQAF